MLKIYQKNARWLLSTVFAIALYIFWWDAYACALAYHEQMQLFLWNTDYLWDRVAEPGGVARYLAEMLVQNYNNVPLGALLITWVLVAMQLLSWVILQRWGCKDSWRNYLLSFLIPIIIWALMGDKDVMTTLPVSVLMVLGMVALTPRKKFSWLAGYAFLMATVGYWVVGPVAIWAALALSVCAFFGNEDKWHVAALFLGLVVVGQFDIFGSARIFPYPVSRIARGIDYYREPLTFFPQEWYSSEEYEQLDYSMLVRKQDWNAIIAKAEKSSPTATASVAALKLAQWKTDVLSDTEMRDFIASYHKLDNPTNILMKSDVFFHLGMINASRRYAFEYKQLIGNHNQSGRVLRRLAETELVSGHVQLAKKYINILRETTYYSRWAEEILPLTYDRQLLVSHPIYGVLVNSFPVKDLIFQ